MSYARALGQAKLLPGQINFQTTRTGRIPSLQPLIEAGLPPAPYMEHGSYDMGYPPILRYGRDPYRGLMDVGQITPADTAAAVHNTIQGTIDAARLPAAVIGTGVVVGAAAGLAGGLLGRTVIGTLLGGVGGGILGWLAYKNFVLPAAAARPTTP